MPIRISEFRHYTTKQLFKAIWQISISNIHDRLHTWWLSGTTSASWSWVRILLKAIWLLHWERIMKLVISKAGVCSRQTCIAKCISIFAPPTAEFMFPGKAGGMKMTFTTTTNKIMIQYWFHMYVHMNMSDPNFLYIYIYNILIYTAIFSKLT